jgi:hypothetical protein
MRPPGWVRNNAGFLIHFELSLGVSLVLLAVLLWVFQPRYTGGMFQPDTTIIDVAGRLAGPLLAAFGWLWMLRIATADPDRDGDHWRLRSMRP